MCFVFLGCFVCGGVGFFVVFLFFNIKFINLAYIYFKKYLLHILRVNIFEKKEVNKSP